MNGYGEFPGEKYTGEKIIKRPDGRTQTLIFKEGVLIFADEDTEEAADRDAAAALGRGTDTWRL